MAGPSRRNFLVGVAALPLLTAGAAAAPSLKTILARHAAVRGSMRHIRSMTTTLEITEGGNTVTGYYAAMRSPAERMRIDVFYKDRRVWSEGLDAQGAWKQDGDSTAPSVSEKGAGALRHGIVLNLHGLEQIPALGGSLADAGGEDVDGIVYHRVRATLDDGFASTFYIDPKTWLISRRRDVRPIHPDVDNTDKPMENAYGDYRRVSGVMTAFKSWQTDLSLGKTVQTTSNLALAYNHPISESRLSRDAAALQFAGLPK